MNIRAHLPIALLLVLLAGPRPRAETLAQSDATYQASLDKMAAESQRQEEGLTAAYRKRLEAAKAGFQRVGDLPGVLAADALLAHLSGNGAAVAPAGEPPAALAKDAAAHESSLVRLRATRVEQERKLGQSYAVYLEGKVKEHTKGGRFADAQACQTRLEAVRASLPAPLAAPAPVAPVTPPTTAAPVRPVKPESTAQKWRALAREAGLELWLGGKERDLRDLDVVETSEGFVITTPKNPGAYHKLLLGGGSLLPGDEIRIVARGIYTFEFVSADSLSTALSAPPASEARASEVVFRRTATGGEMVIDGNTRTTFARNGMKESALAAFWAGEVCAAVTVQDVRTVAIKTVEVKRAAPAKGKGR